MIYTDMTKKAIKLICEKHKNQFDKSGMPYVLHPIHVAENMDDEMTTICALLHDIVEDTDVTFDELQGMNFPIEVISALKYLTHSPNVDYFDYIKKIGTNEIATKVKIEDLKHNCDLTRLDKITENDLIRLKKYEASLEYLQQIQNLREQQKYNEYGVINNKIY